MLQYFLPRIPKNRGPVNRPSGGNEKILDYTDCDPDTNHICNIQFTLDEPFKGDVYLYYGLEGFYQNMRSYVRDRDKYQLIGEFYPDVNCDNASVVPCGAIANSMFNDSFTMIFGDGINVPLTSDGIDVSKLRKKKYRNPQPCSSTPCPGFKNSSKPSDWRKHIRYLGDNATGFALENFDFIVWMETAALPDFRKIYRRVGNDSPLIESGLPNGTYNLTVYNHFRVKIYGGRKKFIISTRTLFRPAGFFHSVSYFFLGCILLSFTTILFCQKFLFRARGNYYVEKGHVP
ncbi:LEM3 (ligand-effect modulator 3) family / CDC50 family domain-containing protein [Ditylenchus destructor]|uniref:LEM3 (Ligand-effect modulator 3) family / CDC50 family domain-containing protein n=1 Tax=Ditylenchus destructor TaxID=166010 RepID=A0AAD4NFR3_9BILA|nr:LEM3 (ligand-effect modulator 3) family / CDC50 family domain-containing protein [Ditylenchus destructor]